MNKKVNAIKRFITAMRWGSVPVEYKGNTELAIIREMAVAAGFAKTTAEVPGSTVAEALNFLSEKMEEEATKENTTDAAKKTTKKATTKSK